MLPDSVRRYALVCVVVGTVGAVYGALVALAQTDLKRMIAYTRSTTWATSCSAVGAAALVTGADEASAPWRSPGP